MPVTKNFTGANVDPGTYDALVELAAVCSPTTVDAIDGFGSYSTNSNSAGMDTGGGHCDINAVGLSDAEARRIETNARMLGFVAYFRPATNPYTGKPYGWQRHVHLLRRDCTDLSTQARWQVGQYDAGWDGLANRHKDTGSRAYVGMTWAKYMEANVTNEQMQQILAAIKAVPAATWATTVNRSGTQVNALQELADGKTTALAIAKAVQGVDADMATSAAVAEVKAALAMLQTAVDALPKA